MAGAAATSTRRTRSGRGSGLATVGLFAALAFALQACGPRIDERRGYTRLELAKSFLARGDLEAAEQEARKSLAFDRGNEETLNLLGLVDFLYAARNFRLIEVEECLTGVDAQGLRRELDGHLRSAEKQFATAVRLAPDYGEAWANRGKVALHLDQHAKAIEYLARALRHPARLENIALTRGDLGWAHFHRRDYPMAAKELRQAVQFQPGICVASYRLGRVYFGRKEWEKALEKFREVAADPSCPMQESELYLMKTSIQLGMFASLSEMARRCVALAPKSCIAVQCRSLVR